MSLTTFIENLKTVIAGDVDVTNWVTSNFGATAVLTQIDGTPDVEMVHPNELPANVFDIGDATFGPMAVGGQSQDVDDQVLMGFVFYENDPAVALQQRIALADLIPTVIRKNRTLIGPGTGCWINRRQSDQGVRHPIHVMVFTVAGQYESLN